MKYGITPLPPNVEELLSQEREIPPQPESTRRRAALRARTALWHARSGSLSTLRIWLRQARLVVASALFTSLGFGAWIALEHSPPAVAPSSTEFDRAFLSAATDVRKNALMAREQMAPSSTETPVAAASARTARANSGPSSRPRSAFPLVAPSPRELEGLETARHAVARGEHSRALSLLAVHRQRFPQSQLDEEREALRIRALQGAGFDEQARQAAKAFETERPDSVLTPALKDSNAARSETDR
jgi:hypothetical protein